MDSLTVTCVYRPEPIVLTTEEAVEGGRMLACHTVLVPRIERHGTRYVLTVTAIDALWATPAQAIVERLDSLAQLPAATTRVAGRI